MNYARHIGSKKDNVRPTGVVQFFDDTELSFNLLRIRDEQLHHWAFWNVPAGAPLKSFAGRMIGEDRDKRCARLSHAPKECDTCRLAPHA